MHEREDHHMRERLIAAGVLTDVQMRVVDDYQRSVGGALRDIVVRLGFAREEDVAKALAAVPAVVVDHRHIASEHASKLPVKLLQGYCVLPIHSAEGVILACEHELEPIVREELWDLLGMQLPLVTVPQGTVTAALDELSRSRVTRKSPSPVPEPARPGSPDQSMDASRVPGANTRPEAGQPSAPPASSDTSRARSAAAQLAAIAHPHPEPPRTVVPEPLPDLSVRELSAFLIARGLITENDLRSFAAACRALVPSSTK